jgi:hypothetical protein
MSACHIRRHLDKGSAWTRSAPGIGGDTASLPVEAPAQAGRHFTLPWEKGLCWATHHKPFRITCRKAPGIRSCFFMASPIWANRQTDFQLPTLESGEYIENKSRICSWTSCEGLTVYPGFNSSRSTLKLFACAGFCMGSGYGKAGEPYTNNLSIQSCSFRPVLKR